MPALWMLFASFTFALMSACVKLASLTYSTSEIVMYRGLIGSLLLLPIIHAQGGTLKTPYPKEHLWRSVVGVLSLWLWFYGIVKLPLATAVTLNYMAPIWLATWMFGSGWWRGKGLPEWPLALAIAMSFVGVTLVLRPAVETREWLGGVAAIASSVIAAMAYLQVRRLGQMGEPEYRVVFYFSLTMGVAGFVGALFDSGHSLAHAQSWRGFGLLAVIGAAGVVAQIAMTRAYRLGSVLVVANLQYTGIIFSSLWGMLLWGDVFAWQVWLGMGVILASGIAATFYNTRSAARASAIEPTAPPDPIASEA
ncbi:DMT family transporter [Massilia sp. 9096]|uniref:DMT family transporter n=1 Tax=Massilia sp. 9096 TaxID=1500894 RepID=UPI00056285B6|nr:DMT family transporter [Massilia sp. 9096]